MECFLSVLLERLDGPRRLHTKCYVIYSMHVVSSVGCVGPKGVVSSICASVLFSSGTCDLFWEVIFAERFCILTSWLVDIRSVGIGWFRSVICGWFFVTHAFAMRPCPCPWNPSAAICRPQRPASSRGRGPTAITLASLCQKHSSQCCSDAYVLIFRCADLLHHPLDLTLVAICRSYIQVVFITYRDYF